MTESLLYVDCFDDYNTPSQRWPAISVGSEWVISTTTVRTGSQALKSLGTNGNARLGQNFPTRTTAIFGFAVYCTFFPGAESSFVEFYDGAGGNPQVNFTIDGGGTLRARRGTQSGTLLGTGSAILAANAWHYVEFKAKIDPSAGTIDMWLDGVNILSLTGQNTQFTANAFFGTLRLAEVAIVYYDDLYMLDPTVGGAYSTPLGDVKMLLSMPSGNGTTNNFTNAFASYVNGTAYMAGQQLKDPNGNVQRCTTPGTASTASPTWATTGGATTSVGGGCVFTVVGTGANPGAANWMAVSEVAPDDNNSYVTDATAGDIDRYTYPAIAGSAVKAVAVNMRAEKDDAGTRTIRAACKSGATVADSGTDLALALNSYANYQGFFDTDPNTGVAWTVSGVNAAEFGVKTTA